MPQQNGGTEQVNLIIVEMARSMFHAQQFKLSFWAEGVVSAVYIINRCLIRALISITLEESWSGQKPCITHMRVFGCIAYVKVGDAKRFKFHAKSIKCLFFCYCEGTQATRLMCIETRKIIKNRDVVFDEESTSVDDV